MEDVKLLHHFGDLGYDLHRGGARPDNSDTLTFEIDIVVPARGVEGLALIRFHAINAGEARRRQNTVCQHHVARLHRVAPVRVYGPALCIFIPDRLFYCGVE